MPEMTFRIRWPDGHEEDIRSPSTVIRHYFRAGDRFLVTEFVARARGALGAASERSADPFGFACERTTDQLTRIEQTADRFRDDHEAWVSVVALRTTLSKPVEVRVVASA